MDAFLPFSVLLPKPEKLSKWAVIACDQFSTDPAYWARVGALVGSAPSALRLILPEGESPSPEAVEQVHRTMAAYLSRNVLSPSGTGFVYVERALENGALRPGIVGVVDLEGFGGEAPNPVRATEETVSERYALRCALRRNASLEVSHTVVLCDDPENTLLGPITAARDTLPRLYGFSLMEGGGQITGFLVEGERAAAFQERLKSFPGFFAVGDGNHALAAAKQCYLERKNRGGAFRYAMVELENLRHPAVTFTPIHRLVPPERSREVLEYLRRNQSQDGPGVELRLGPDREILRFGSFPVGKVQSLLDVCPEGMAYFHQGEQPVGAGLEILFPKPEKDALFPFISAHGRLPRKAFSLGLAREKRYYLEGRSLE